MKYLSRKKAVAGERGLEKIRREHEARIRKLQKLERKEKEAS
jgi:hypothetical protein